jgi:hypothetical protein
MKYEIIEATKTTTFYIQRTDPDGKVWSIPMNESNSDYQAYLASLEAPTV